MRRHGTISGYVGGCRCDDCRSAASLQKGRAPEGMLLSTCWCDTDPVAVTGRDVFEGRTKSCGRPACQPRVSVS